MKLRTQLLETVLAALVGVVIGLIVIATLYVSVTRPWERQEPIPSPSVPTAPAPALRPVSQSNGQPQLGPFFGPFLEHLLQLEEDSPYWQCESMGNQICGAQ